jgi:1-acyl-sn-glycerol-3-phosphate acyltransferase
VLPTPIRRPLTITAWIAFSVVVLVLSPLLLGLSALAAAALRRRPPLLVCRLLIAYCARELAVLIACGLLWVLSGFGIRMRAPRFQRLHYRLLRWLVHGVAARARQLFDVDVTMMGSAEAAAAMARDRPLLFFSRHAGPGDSLLLVDLLLTQYHRLPSVVFKETLAIDPCVDLIGHRLPHAVLDTSQPEKCEQRIAEVASRLLPQGVLLLFPEGANYSPQRRRRALGKLWHKGQRREAEAGEQMSHVMPPHPGGALAALRGNPDADVIFGAHTGLGLAVFPGELWRNPPIGRTLTTRMWLARAADRSHDPDEQVKWLYSWWARLDQWVEQRGEEVPRQRL